MVDKKSVIGKKEILVLFGVLIFSLILFINFISAEDPTVIGNANITANLTKHYNYSSYGVGTFRINLSVQTNYLITGSGTGANNGYNATLYCNRTGGPVGVGESPGAQARPGGKDLVKIVTIWNSSATQIVLENASVNLKHLGTRYTTPNADNGRRTNESTLFNCSVFFDNYTNWNWSQTQAVRNITFDVTPPDVGSYYNETVWTIFKNITKYANYSNFSRGGDFKLMINVTINDTIFYMNESSTGWVYFNVTFVNGTAVRWINASMGLPEGPETNQFFNNSFDIRQLQDGVYNITVFANDSVNNLNSSERIQFTIDRTPPNVSAYYGVVNRGNYSRSITLNVSVTDNLLPIYSVYFNITYPNGTQIVGNYTNASAVFTGGYHTLTVSTTGFIDGNYNITVYANDSLGNSNILHVQNQSSDATNHQYIRTIFDSTIPTGSLSCTPSSVYSGDVVTCACASSDATSGVKTTTFTSHPATGNTGTFTETCSIVDYAGNSLSPTTTYIVELSSSGSSGGGTGPSSTPKPVKTTETWPEITPTAPSTMSGFAEDTGVDQIQIEVSQTANNVKVTVDKYESKPSAVETAKSGSYKYIHVETKNLENLSKATMKIQVEKSWISSKSLTKEDVALFKYDETSKKWNELTTTYSNEDDKYYYYTVELDSFSYFTIASKKAVVEEEQPAPEEEQPSAYLGLPTWAWIVIGLVVLGIISGIAYKMLGKKKK